MGETRIVIHPEARNKESKEKGVLALWWLRVKNPPGMQETQAQSLSGEDPLEKEMATHFSILAWRITWTEEPGGLQSTGSQRARHDRVTNTQTHKIPSLGPYPHDLL